MKENYLLDKKIKIYQPDEGYHASSDAVWLAAAIKKIKDGDKILDVGSGTGAVSLCLAERFQKQNPQIVGIEVQQCLAEAATKSAIANRFDFVSFINADIFDTEIENGSFDHVITNPPYALNDLQSPNESKAIAHNFQHEDLSKWLDFCIKKLKPKGFFYIINRTEALENIVADISKKMGAIEVFLLYSKEGQKAKRVIIRAQKGSKAPLCVHYGIVVHNADGSYSAKSEEVLRKGEYL